ncbi:hypothetical protein tloyanaT_28310 [Thalassotalea loyana]|uniref:VOC domain-containing protein n=1 Tax=Thalassotalea loyana TaxID=280483 RepID=A0ABQ6HER6_9GAMM|nr:VOC family protein [Thalassotalea loyana]GLX86578.1 hypothetical protein tloyanaT_28310 [Thalassotalea loyana]
MDNQIVWVDMPVVNLDRAIKFYSAVLGNEVKKESFNDCAFGLLPHAQTNVSGCLVEMGEDQITQQGPLLYFNVNGRIDDAIEQAKTFGGTINEPLMDMGEHGKRVVVIDSEGNRIALHSQ